MKIKRLNEDFQVVELSAFAADGGPCALYRLKKRSLGTLEAIEAVARRWRIPRERFAFGGLKDKHALTEQFVTIRHGPRRNLAQQNLELTYLGQADRDFEPQDVAANRFAIVVRDLAASEADRAADSVAAVKRDGLPNYFDDQRFGSIGESGEFIARAWCAGDFERALWLALADPHPDDRSDDREQKRLLREHWGDWPACQRVLAPSDRRHVVAGLVQRPGDFRRAFARLRVDLRGLYLAAYQSFLWNRMLAALLRRACPADRLVDVRLKLDPVPFFRGLTPEEHATLRGTELPLPSARLHLEPGPMRELIDEVLRPLGIELRELRVKYPRDSFFSRGDRAVLVAATGLSHAAAADELYAGRQKLTLGFELPRGAYATILIKRLIEC